MYQNSKDHNCANDNVTALGETAFDLLAAQDMFSPEKALEILQLLTLKEQPSDIQINIIS